jgi:hypothetical protein
MRPSSVLFSFPVVCSDAGQAVDASPAESVAGAFEGADVGIVDDAVDHGGGDRVTEHACPAGEGQVPMTWWVRPQPVERQYSRAA